MSREKEDFSKEAGEESGELTPKKFLDLISEFYITRFTGTLELKRDRVEKTIFFNKGFPTWVESSDVSETFSRMLLNENRIDINQYVKATEMVKERGCKFGEALVEMGVFHNTELYNALKQHAANQMASCYSWNSGTYATKMTAEFVSNLAGFDIYPYSVILLAIRLYQDYLEAAEELTEHKGLSIQLSKTPEWQNLNPFLNELERNIVYAIKDKIQIIDLIQQFPNNIGDLFKFIGFLDKTDFIYFTEAFEQVEIDQIISETEIVPEIEEEIPDIQSDMLGEYLNLMDKNYYVTLNVEQSASQAEIDKAYNKSIRKYSDSHIETITNSEIKQRATALYSKINIAYETLKDPAKRSEYDKVIERMKKEMVKEIVQQESEQYFALAIQLLSRNKFSLAEEQVRKAINSNPDEALYYAYLGWIIYRNEEQFLEGRLEKAKNEINKALGLNSGLAQAYYFLGVISKENRNQEDAEKYLVEALRNDPGHVEANKLLQDLPIHSYTVKLNAAKQIKIIQKLLAEND